MKNTTVGIDYSQVRREVYAESACVALMMGGHRPEIITEDNEMLVNLYIETAIVEVVASFIGFVGKGVEIGGATVSQIPFIVPEDISMGAFRRLIERSVAAKTMELLYEGDERLSVEYRKRFGSIVASAKQLLATPSVMI